MGIPGNGRLYLGLFALLASSLAATSGRADEIRLKDGKKLYGVIVSYEDNMFKVKTDFGYVLVEKDKIAQIIPNTPPQGEAGKTEIQPAAKPGGETQPKAEPAVASSNAPAPGVTNASAKDRVPPAPSKRERAAAIVSNANTKPAIPAATAASADPSAPTLKTAAGAPKSTLSPVAAPPPPPKEESPANREEIQGNLYINHSHGFHMYKAPSWQVIEGAGQTLPNAIVAMGTTNESTLLVIGLEKTKAPLESAAKTVEARLHDVYDNYRLISQRKTVVGELPAIEYRYRGMADNHDWSGTLVVVSRGADVFTVLGMTFADSDLIQIQENVIARSIASLDLSVK
jgi:small nuclear ribonucleoprotein (snRNP)-like protein